MHFGEKIKQLRTLKNWTQPQLAEAIGIEQSYLSKLENGKSVPSADIFQLILKVFEMDTHTILNEVDSSVIHRQLRQIPEVANFLKHRESATIRNRKIWIFGASVSTILGIVLAVSSFFALVFPETQYNYKSTGIVLAGESKEIFSNYLDNYYGDNLERVRRQDKMKERYDEHYILTERYKGQIFNVPVTGGSRTYRLTKQLELVRIENRIMGVIAILFILLGLFGFLLENKMTKD
jgi:transcriptional regulator with XRE-family HTH domain